MLFKISKNERENENKNKSEGKIGGSDIRLANKRTPLSVVNTNSYNTNDPMPAVSSADFASAQSSIDTSIAEQTSKKTRFNLYDMWVANGRRSLATVNMRRPNNTRKPQVVITSSGESFSEKTPIAPASPEKDVMHKRKVPEKSSNNSPSPMKPEPKRMKRTPSSSDEETLLGLSLSYSFDSITTSVERALDFSPVMVEGEEQAIKSYAMESFEESVVTSKESSIEDAKAGRFEGIETLTDQDLLELKDAETGNTILHYLVKYGEESLIEEMMERASFTSLVNARNNEDATPFLKALPPEVEYTVGVMKIGRAEEDDYGRDIVYKNTGPKFFASYQYKDPIIREQILHASLSWMSMMLDPSRDEAPSIDPVDSMSYSKSASTSLELSPAKKRLCIGMDLEPLCIARIAPIAGEKVGSLSI